MPKFKSVEEESSFWDRHSILEFGTWNAVPYEKICEELAARAEPKLPVTPRPSRRPG